MAKNLEVNKMGEDVSTADIVDDIFGAEDDPQPLIPEIREPIQDYRNIKETVRSTKALVNCLRDEKVRLAYIPRKTGLVTDPKHVLYGGLGENSKIRIVVPRLESGIYKNVLTNDEKDFLEHVMGLPHNALSVYLKVDNYWANRGPLVGKEGITLNLADPENYIYYKIALVNTDLVAPSREAYNKLPKATYRFVIDKDGEDIKQAVTTVSAKSKAYKLFGSIENDLKKLVLIGKIITGKVVKATDKDAVHAFIGKVIEENTQEFIDIASGKFIDTQLLIEDCILAGIIRKRGIYYYLTEDNRPLCNENQDPTLQSACEYINAPKNQELKLLLETKVKG